MVKTRKNPFLIPFKHTNPMPGEDFFGINLQDDEGIFRPISDKKRIEASKKNKMARLSRKRNKRTKS